MKLTAVATEPMPSMIEADGPEVGAAAGQEALRRAACS